VIREGRAGGATFCSGFAATSGAANSVGITKGTGLAKVIRSANPSLFCVLVQTISSRLIKVTDVSDPFELICSHFSGRLQLCQESSSFLAIKISFPVAPACELEEK